MDYSRCCCWYVHIFIIISAISVACSASISSKEKNEQDRMSLLALRDEFIAGGTPLIAGALDSWNASLNFCEWQGITCGKRHKRVTKIKLIEEKLNGVVSSSIGNLTFLRSLFLTNNSLHGEIPKQVGQLWRLQDLILSGNSFEGRIPVELSNCSNILQMSFYDNNLSGRIPPQLVSLSKITFFDVERNNLMGQMPIFFRNFSSLSKLNLRYNYFHGEVGDSLQGLSKLEVLYLSGNSFSGTISQLYNLSSLDRLMIHSNHFTGTLAQDMDVALPKLTWFSIWNNSFTGSIPSSLSNISGLTVCDLSMNRFWGRVPHNLGKLKNLWILQLSDNSLGSEMPNNLRFVDSLTNCTKLEKLDLGENKFSGPLSDSIGNFTFALQRFSISNNHITGRISERIGELSGLSWVNFIGNIFIGTIPTSIGKLTNLSKLYLGHNNLHGEIPSSIGNLTNLLTLYLASNSLDGIIPTALGSCKGMQSIDISNNHLTGSLPDNVFTQLKDLIWCDLSHNSFSGTIMSVFGMSKNLYLLNASYNRISGEIPAQLGELLSLEYLQLTGNFFKGSIPPSLGSLRGLIHLDLSNNNLSGAIPKELTYVEGLQNLNLSFNQLEGEVPWFKNVTQLSVTGNSKLCGGNLGLQLRPCLHSRTGKAFSRKVIIAITLSALTSIFLLLLLFIYLCIGGRHRNVNIDGSTEGYQRVTYAELLKATEDFAESNLVGTGSFGDVYRGYILDENKERKPIAVKVLKLSKHGATRSFTSECKVLRRIRHRNLLRIITSCSSLDHKGNDFKALVFDFMSNGNLDSWLHFSDQQQRETRVLSLAKRVEIAIDVGRALDYLHNGCETPIVHCDLKPSNILLDDDMVAHVCDFGLAKILHGVTENLSGGESLSTAIKGSIGYVAPEHGMGAAISIQGDIYSYGIILLELITGKMPTDDMFNNGMSLRSICEIAISSDHVHVEEVIDQCLVNELHEAAATQRNSEQIKFEYHIVLVSFVEIGISCSAESSRDRMDIQSAVKCLERIKEKCNRV